MADEEIKDLENEELKENQDTKEGLEINTEDVPDSSGNKPDDGPSVVRGLMEKLGLRKSEETKEVEGEDIPDEFTNIANAVGWTNDEVQEFAEGRSNEELIALIPYLTDSDDKDSEEEPEKKADTQLPEKKEEVKDDELKSAIDAALKPYLEKIDGLEKRLTTVDKERAAKDQQILLTSVNKAFDVANKEFGMFGDTKKLPVWPAGPKKGQLIVTSPEMIAREEVWKKAEAFVKTGTPIDEAMKDALIWYKGKYMEKDIKRNLIKDLKNHEKKLSAKRTSKQTVTTYESEDDRKAAVVRELAEKKGIKLPENDE